MAVLHSSSHCWVKLAHWPFCGLQNSSVHSLPSSGHITISPRQIAIGPKTWQVLLVLHNPSALSHAVPGVVGVPLHWPSRQRSLSEQSLKSLHAVLSGTGAPVQLPSG